MTAIQLRRWTPKGSEKPVRIYVNGLTGLDQDEKVWLENARGGISLKRRLPDGKFRADKILLGQILADLAEAGIIDTINVNFDVLEDLARSSSSPTPRRPRKPLK